MKTYNREGIKRSGWMSLMLLYVGGHRIINGLAGTRDYVVFFAALLFVAWCIYMVRHLPEDESISSPEAEDVS